jgi:hypothetical protein
MQCNVGTGRSLPAMRYRPGRIGVIVIAAT